MITKETIDKLQSISVELENTANSSQNFNAPMANYVEKISYEIYKLCNDLREIQYMTSLSQMFVVGE